MTRAKTSPLLGLLLISTVAFLAVGCGRPGEGAPKTPAPGWTWTPPTWEPTATPFPTMTPPPPLPKMSTVTLEPAGGPAGDGYLPDGIYLADALTGQAYRVVTAPGPVLQVSQWVSPTQLVLFAWGPTDYSYYLLDLDAKTLRRLPVRADGGAVSFSHSSGLMTSTGPAGELIISSIADGREVARVANGPASMPHGGPYLSWAPDDKHIFFRSADGTGEAIVSVESSPVVIPVTAWNNVGAPPWMPDGSAIVMGDADSLFSVDATTGETARLYSWQAGGTMPPRSPSISPDGRYAFAMTGAGPGGHAYVVPLDGSSGGFQITNVETLDSDWSTAEDVLGVIADRCTEEARLLLVTPDGTVRATFNDASFIPRFSANGQMLAYVGGHPAKAGVGNEWGIVVRSATGDHDFISFIPNVFDDTVWSPDGRWFAGSSGGWGPPYMNSCATGLPKTEIAPLQ